MRPTTTTPYGHVEAEHHAAHNDQAHIDTLRQSKAPCGPERPHQNGHVETEHSTMRPTTSTLAWTRGGRGDTMRPERPHR
ncbi:hypothetical protein PTSG_12480 [Salpingoeca rosetta]|uniref:Uncharacterized protein n=1 Tax=Salpingoeca rosetta (strain ATCC 50818 / BSB-021) TaxID=946362 RepID=F2UEP5_SALR5|nr:uncharacterized protein PTSG_12480 [Salpingoeca rosetta]EGD75095.1 hypothetical protein PTSG_12480 [Salpingoeca rosetta]|eukprot:XP_004992148.1 hypothetical protein PTSG_12480 [Salpingoeca rosetta]